MPEASVSRYGKGNTISSRQRFGSERVENYQVQDKTGTATVSRLTRKDETRSRTYYERDGLSLTVGAQRQDSLVRSELSTSYESPAATVGGVEVARLRTESHTEGFIGTQSDVEAGIDLGSDPRAEVKAGVFVGARVDTESKATVDVLGASASTTAEGSASVGAEAGVGSSVSSEGAEVGASAFAGARAEGSVSGEVGGVGATANGEAWAGVGAEAKGTAKFEDGKLTFGTEAGAAIGVGGKVGYSTTIDLRKVQNDSSALAKNGSRLAIRVGKDVQPELNLQLRRGVQRYAAAPLAPVAFQPVARSPIQWQANARMKTAQTATQQLTKTGGNVAKKASRVTKTAGTQVKRTAKTAAKKTTKKAKKTVRKVGKAAKGLFGK